MPEANTTRQSLRSLEEAFVPDLSSATALLLVRHAEAVSTVADGQDEASRPLSEKGRRQAEALAAHLAEVGIDALYSSPVTRTMETAQEIARRTGLQISVEPAVREVAFVGGVDKQPRNLTALRDWLAAPGRRFPLRWKDVPFLEDGESLRARVRPALERIAAAESGRTVVVVTHAGVINAYVASVIGLEDDFFFLPAPTSISRVTITTPDAWAMIHSLNGTSHLDRAPV